MGVALVRGIEDEVVARGIEHAVQGDGRLHDTQIRTEMTAQLIDALDDGSAAFCGELVELVKRERIEVARTRDML